MIKIIANSPISITALVKIRSARGIFFCPKLMAKLTLPPIPIIKPKAICKTVVGKQTATPAKPRQLREQHHIYMAVFGVLYRLNQYRPFRVLFRSADVLTEHLYYLNVIFRCIGVEVAYLAVGILSVGR